MKNPFLQKKQKNVSEQDYQRALKSVSLPFISSMAEKIMATEGDTRRYHLLMSRKVQLNLQAEGFEGVTEGNQLAGGDKMRYLLSGGR